MERPDLSSHGQTDWPKLAGGPDSIGRILVPLDLSEMSHRVVAYAALMGVRFSASVELLHVWEGIEIEAGPADESSLSLGEATRLVVEQEMMAFSKQHADRLPYRWILRSGHPSEVILDQAKSGGYDLVVMGTHGRTGLPHLLLGSVAERVLRHAPCPVLVIPNR